MRRIAALIHKYKHAWLLLYACIYLPWFCYLERTVTGNYHVMHAALDDLIPFCEYFIVPYLLWFLYVGAAIFYFLFTSREDYYKLCVFLFSGMTISLIICTFFRNGTDLRPVVDSDKNAAISEWCPLIHRADTSHQRVPQHPRVQLHRRPSGSLPQRAPAPQPGHPPWLRHFDGFNLPVPRYF